MSAMLSGVLKLTFGFLAKTFHSEVAEHHGDMTDEQCRRLIAVALENIKSKLDGLARKDLSSSLHFLQEGVGVLYQSLFQLKASENTAESTEQATKLEDSCGPDIPMNDTIALINAADSLKIYSKERSTSAIESFKLAREKATEAFCNESLSIEDRIQASQLQIIARILENLEDSDGSTSDCLQYLKQLHNIKAVQETFSVVIDGEVKSEFNNTGRIKNALSVHRTNQLLFHFARKFTNLRAAILDWPTIWLGTNSYHPLLGEDRLVEKLEGSGEEGTSLYPDFTFSDNIFPPYSVVTSEREIVAQMLEKDSIKSFKMSGEYRTLCEVPQEKHASLCQAVAMDIDAEDSLFFIIGFQKSNDQSWAFKLFILDKNGNKKLEHPLPFHQNSTWPEVRMTINKDGKIAILNCLEKMLYIGKVCVELSSFKVDESFHLNELFRVYCIDIRFSDINGTKIISADDHIVHIYTGYGQIQRKIKIPAGHGDITSIAINHITKCILVKTRRSTSNSLFIFSETGELIDSICLGPSGWIGDAKLTSHPNGAVALAGERGAALLHL